MNNRIDSRLTGHQLLASTLEMGAESVPETLEHFDILTRLLSRENFIEFVPILYCTSKSHAAVFLKTCIKYP